MLREDRGAERIAVATHQEVITWLDHGYPTTYAMMASLLADDEEHADDLRSLLVGPRAYG